MSYVNRDIRSTNNYPTNIIYIPDFFFLGLATVPLADPVKTAVGLEKENYSYTK